MKVNSISGLTYQVKDLAKTAEFYEGLGFRRGKDKDGSITLYVNWFFVTFVAQEGSGKAKVAGAGVSLYIKVDGLDDFHAEVLAAGLEPEGEPEVGATGIREFTLRDPDGYRLTFFEKK